MPATTEVTGHTTPIPGLLIFDVTKVGDDRGYFQEKFQQAKLRLAGLPEDFVVVQNNISFNKETGVTRGLHAEPWEKYISIISGRAFAVWCDLRRGDSFGTVFFTELTPEKAVFVPRGIANGYQTQEPDVIYGYLVNEHWSPDGQYQSVHMFDPELNIPWPIAQTEAIISDKDKSNPLLRDVTPMEF